MGRVWETTVTGIGHTNLKTEDKAGVIRFVHTESDARDSGFHIGQDIRVLDLNEQGPGDPHFVLESQEEKTPTMCARCGGYMNIPVQARDGKGYHKWCDPKEVALTKLQEADGAYLKVKYNTHPSDYLESQEHRDFHEALRGARDAGASLAEMAEARRKARVDFFPLGGGH